MQNATINETMDDNSLMKNSFFLFLWKIFTWKDADTDTSTNQTTPTTPSEGKIGVGNGNNAIRADKEWERNECCGDEEEENGDDDVDDENDDDGNIIKNDEECWMWSTDCISNETGKLELERVRLYWR